LSAQDSIQVKEQLSTRIACGCAVERGEAAQHGGDRSGDAVGERADISRSIGEDVNYTIW
jgi:hypothetical protein